MPGTNPGLVTPGLGNDEVGGENDADETQAELERQAKKAKETRILAELAASAPTLGVRDCLRKYDVSKEQWQIINALKQESKKILVETLAYLGVPNMHLYLATALPNELLCRIQNLLPDKCHECKDTYCLKVTDKPIICCVKCGQGCHNKCILPRINKTEQDLINLTKAEREALINPYGSIGLFYVCGHCQEQVIPQKNAGLMKHVSKRATKEANTQSNNPAVATITGDAGTQEDTGPPETDTVSTDGGHNDAEAVRPNRRVTIDDNPTIHVIADIPADGETIAVSAGDASAVLDKTLPNNQAEPLSTADNQALAINERPHAPPAPVCKHYKNARCKYGISGKKDGEGVCPYSHPKLCKKLIEHGNRGQRGCTKGDNCELFHPKMCHRSLRDRTCINPSCKFMHVKGTKRSDLTIQVGESTNINYRDERRHSHAAVSSTHQHRMPNNSYPTPQYAAPQYAAPQYAATPNPRENQPQDYFLDALHQMKAEILKELDRKLQQTYPMRVNHQIIPQMYNTLPVHQTIPNHPIHPQNMQNQIPPLHSQNQGQMVTH